MASKQQPEQKPARADSRSYAGQTLDPTPPPDHDDFVEARSLGLRAMREKLARQRKPR